MLEQLASDDRLLPSVRAAIAQLRPALLRLAVADPRFFSDKQHPARALLRHPRAARQRGRRGGVHRGHAGAAVTSGLPPRATVRMAAAASSWPRATR